MRRIAVVLMLLVLALSALAVADTAQLTFTGPGGGSSGGVYTYPYELTVNGTAASLMCDTFQNEITQGEQWTATVNHLADGGTNGLFKGSGQQTLYNEAGLLYLGAVNGTITGDIANWAVWNLFDPNTPNSSGLTDPYSSAQLADALASVSGYTSGLANVLIYTPNGDGDAIGTGPQEFLGLDPPPVPEPTSMVLLGSGVLAFAGTLRRRFLKT
jgi:hypothetical protein